VISFRSPENILIGILIVIVVFFVKKFLLGSDSKDYYFPSAQMVLQASSWLRHIPKVVKSLLALSILLFLISLGYPTIKSSREIVSAKGVDIVLALDISTSMSAKDFKPENRLEAARVVMRDFIKNRPHDRIALVTFAADSYIVCPLTAEHYSLLSLLDSVRLISFGLDGTNISMALLSALNRLRSSKARSKVVILLTDGVNNRGEISPVQAAEFCKRYHVKVYTVCIGSKGITEVMARRPDGSPAWIKAHVDYDYDTLKKIASITGGKSYMVTNTNMLRDIYGQINRMERSILEKKTVTYKTDLFFPVIRIAAALFVLLFVILILFPLCV